MIKRLVSPLLAVMLSAVLLTGCSATENKNLSGAAAKAALVTVIEKSIATFDKDGGSETVQADGGQYALIYIPSAPLGKRVVTADLSQKDSPAFGTEANIALKSLTQLATSKDLADAKYELANDTFSITTETISITIRSRDDLVITTTLEASASGSSTKQVIMTTYGISKEAQALYDAAK